MSGHWLRGARDVPAAGAQSGRVGLAGLIAGLLVLVFGAPYWSDHPVHAAVASLACAGFAAAGGLLASGGGGRRLTGRLLLAAAFCWPIAWLIAWNHGVAPVVSFYGQGGFFVLAGAAILAYPAGRLAGRERAWVAAAGVVLIGGQLVIQLIARPQWIGLSPTVVWPNLASTPTVFHVAVKATAAAQVVLAVWFAALLWFRARWLSNLDRRVAVPVAVAAALLGLVTSIQSVVQSEAWTNLAALESFYFTQGVIALVVSAALVSGALRDRWWELHAPHRVVRAAASGTSVATVRAALADALRDPSLLLYFWAPSEAGWVDPSGRPAPSDSAGSEAESTAALTGRWRIPIAGDDGESPLALVEVDAALRLRPVLVEAVLRAGSLALLTAQLQAVANAHLAQVIAAQARLEEKELTERRRLEQDLHGGARHRLGELARRLDRLAGLPAGPGLSAIAGACRDEVLATIGELEALAQGLLPTELREEGLGPALDAVVGRLGLTVGLAVSPGRLPPAVETTLYFALCEGLTNVAKYAPDAAVRIAVAVADDGLHAMVSDDGPGGAVIVPGGGLAGIEARTKALNGSTTLESAPGTGTRLLVSLPGIKELILR